MANDDDTEDGKPPAKGEVIPPRRSALELPAASTKRLPNILQRVRSYADKKYYEAKQGEIDAHTGMTRALDDNLRARTNLQQSMLESEEWDEEIERKRIRNQYAIEDMESDAAVEKRRHELEMEARRRELEREQFGQSPKKQPKQQSRSAEDIFREEAEQILRHGAAGKYTKIAQEFKENLIRERGGEEFLTNEDRERIEMMFELARRKQSSKS